MPRAHRGLRGFVRPPKKTVMWIGNSPTTNKVAVDTNTAVLIAQLSAAALALRPFTVMRTRGLVWWESDQDAADEEPTGVYGEIVVTEPASTIGITAIPDPISEPDAAWMIYQPLITAVRFVSGTGVNDPAGSVYEYDSKAMRKVGINDDLVSVVANNSGVDGGLFLTVGRTLIQLH